VNWKTNKNIQPRAHEKKIMENIENYIIDTWDLVKDTTCWHAWVAQLVKHPTLDFGSGYDIKPCVMLCSQWGICLRLSLSLSLSFCPYPLSLSK